jgi:hypothetical protein
MGIHLTKESMITVAVNSYFHFNVSFPYFRVSILFPFMDQTVSRYSSVERSIRI